MICPLCQSEKSSLFDEDKQRTYHLCQACTLVFVPREKILSFQEEASRYEAHQNDASNPEYENYLNEICKSVHAKVEKNSVGLDFGSGRTTLMAKILSSYGHEVESYDLYFHPKESIWEKTYDFIVLSEVIEHLSDPKGVMTRLKNLLKKNGAFFIKTKVYPPGPGEFSRWFYKRDQTHVQFFSYDSFLKLAELTNTKGPERVGEDLYRFIRV